MIYFDNAATTPLDPEVAEVMHEIQSRYFGNPSSTHMPGRESRSIIEESRKQVAQLTGVAVTSIFFTSGGTEAINTAIHGAVEDLGAKNVITTLIEHHAVSHCLHALEKKGKVSIHYVKLLPDGHIDMEHLEKLLAKCDNTLACLMHANNEIGTLLPLEETGALCRKYQATFLTDTVQTLGKYELDLSSPDADFAACSAHKFHGPKGTGFLYIRDGIRISPLIQGGGQERDMRSGTENIAGIAGLSTALKIALQEHDRKRKTIKDLRDYMVSCLQGSFRDIRFNNDLSDKGLYNLLNVSFPSPPFSEDIVQQLDKSGICASGGSACISGITSQSPVLRAIGCDPKRPAVRFSFSKFNTRAEVDQCITILKEIKGA